MPAVQTKPAGQAAQDDAPALLAYVPAAHTCGAPCTQAEPTGQSAHTDCAVELVYLPGGQTVDTPPLQEEPAAHGVQAAADGLAA